MTWWKILLLVGAGIAVAAFAIVWFVAWLDRRLSNPGHYVDKDGA